MPSRPHPFPAITADSGDVGFLFLPPCDRVGQGRGGVGPCERLSELLHHHRPSPVAPRNPAAPLQTRSLRRRDDEKASSFWRAPRHSSTPARCAAPPGKGFNVGIATPMVRGRETHLAREERRPCLGVQDDKDSAILYHSSLLPTMSKPPPTPGKGPVPAPSANASMENTRLKDPSTNASREKTPSTRTQPR
ncbi:hypothetical protein NDU88_002302 [Pleurodeles waltl]|uniref:Uncharacterized protein n=1 Tax=Pleurodeles waltl TaxID=8319 RepID=A0AAV7MNZ6_PLEWA|nr:hypothetical protein NDU88_002302 [Pleurodeles waltl]